MNINEFTKRIQQKQGEIDELFRRKLPIHIGRIATDHFAENFRKSGYVDGGLKPWQKTKREMAGGTSAASQYKPLLSARNHLYSSLKYVPSDYQVTVSNDLLYAPVHNWGGDVSPTVTPKMRRWAWAMAYQAKKAGKDDSLYKALALTKKKKLRIHIPQRQFLGQSKELIEKINKKMEDEVEKIILK